MLLVIKTTVNFIRRGIFAFTGLAVIPFLRLLSPLLRVRIGQLRTDRIGHLALETELTILENNQTSKRRVFDVWFAPKPVCNRALVKIWSRRLTILPSWALAPIYRVNELLPGSKLNKISPRLATVLDNKELLDGSRSSVTLSESELEQGRLVLEQASINPLAKLALVIMRDGAYTKTEFPDKDMSYHDFRNSPISDLVPAIKTLLKDNYWVLRVGSIVEKPLNVDHPHFVDYSNSNWRSDFMDVYLSSICDFCISDGLGFASLPALFRRPNVFTNFTPFGIFYSSRKSDIGILKWIADSETKKMLTLDEIKSRKLSSLTSSQDYSRAGVMPLLNTPDDIRKLILEVIAHQSSTFDYSNDYFRDQNKFKDAYLKCLSPEQRALHGDFRARFGNDFLNDYRHLWDN